LRLHRTLNHRLIKPLLLLLFATPSPASQNPSNKLQSSILGLQKPNCSAQLALDDSKRLEELELLKFEPNLTKLNAQNLKLFNEIRQLLDQLPSNLFNAPFEDLILTVDKHLERGLLFRKNLVDTLTGLSQNPEYSSQRGYILKVIENIQLNETQLLYLRGLFKKYDYIQVGVLLNRRSTDYPNAELAGLVSQLQRLTNQPKGFLSELRAQLAFSNIVSGSDYLSEILPKIFYGEKLKLAELELSNYFPEGAKTFEFDFVYRKKGRIYFVEVKNSNNYSKRSSSFSDKKKEDLLLRHKSLMELFKNLENYTPFKFRLHYIFDGDGVLVDYANQLKELGAKVN